MRPRPAPISAAAYLQDAAKALTACGSGPALYGAYREASEEVRHAIEHWVVNEFDAEAQARFARTSILFSALSAEAYVNEFLDARLSDSDFSAVDRLPTVEKYVVGVRLADSTMVFERGAEPVQTLKRLFETRNMLVHPKPRGRPSLHVTPRAASEFLVAAAKAARLLMPDKASPDEFHLDLILDNPRVFIDWGSRWTGTLPPLLAPDPPGLLTELLYESASEVIRETRNSSRRSEEVRSSNPPGTASRRASRAEVLCT